MAPAVGACDVTQTTAVWGPPPPAAYSPNLAGPPRWSAAALRQAYLGRHPEEDRRATP